MMSDYDRTLELTDAAYNSTGAAQAQFNKTLDSLESKLNILGNAWDEFTMGLANNEAIKMGVDLLTDLLNVINRVGDLLGNSIPASLAKLAIGIGAIKTGGNVVDRLFDNYSQFKRGEIVGADGIITKQAGKRAGSAMLSSVGKTTIDIVGDLGQYVTQGKQIGTAIFQGIKAMAKGEFFTLDKNIISGRTLENLEKPFKKVMSGLEKDMAKLWQDSYTEGEDSSDSESLAKFEKLNKQHNKLRESYEKASLQQISVFNSLLDDGVSVEIARLALEKEITEELTKQLALDGARDKIAREGGELDKKAIDEKGSKIYKKAEKLKNSKVGKVDQSLFGSILEDDSVIGFETKVAGVAEILKKFTGKIPLLDNILTGISSKFGAWAGTLAESAGAGEAASAAFVKLGTSLGTILPIVGAVAVAFVALKAAFDWLHDNSYEGRLEAIGTQIEDAGVAAEAAKQAYDDLLDNRSSSESLLEEINNLAIGTSEFNQKLLESNNLIDQLVRKDIGFTYSDVEVDRLTGAKSISKAAWDRETERQYNNTRNASAALTMLQGQEARIKLEKSNEALNRAYNKTISTPTSSYTPTNPNSGVSNEISNDKAQKRYLSELKNNTEIRAQLENYTDQIISQIGTETSRASGEIGKGLEEYYGNALVNKDMTKDISQRASKLQSQIPDIKELQKLYAETYSIDVDSIEESIKEDKGKLAEGIARAGIVQDVKDQMDLAIKEISLTGKEGRSLAKAMASKGKDLDSETLKDLEELNGNEELLKEVADALSTDTKGVQSIIAKINKNVEKEQQKTLDNIGKTIAKTSGINGGESKNFFDSLVKKSKEAEGYDKERANTQLADLGKIAESIGSADASVTNGILTEYQKATDGIDSKYADFISKINFDSAIEGASQLNKIIEDGSALESAWANNILKSGKDMFSNASQLREYFNGEDFSSDIEAINDSLKDGEKISEQSIRDIAVEGSKLKKVLDNTGMSAETLARIFPKLQSGEIQLNKVSDAALNAISSLGSLEDMYSQVSNFIDNFDKGNDTSKPSKFMSENYDNLINLIKTGQVGNPQIEKTLSGIFGAQHFEGVETAEEYTQVVNKMMTALGNNKNNFVNSWKQLAAGNDVFGESFAGVEEKARLFNETFKEVTNTGSSMEMVFQEGTTLEEAAENIGKITNTTADFGRMMITDFQNTSPNLKGEIEKLELNSAIKRFSGAEFKDGAWSGGKSNIMATTESIDAMSTALGVAKEKFLETAKASGVFIKELPEDITFGSAEAPIDYESLRSNTNKALNETRTGLTVELLPEITNTNDFVKNYNLWKKSLEDNGIQITPEIDAAGFESMKQELLSNAKNGLIEVGDGVKVPVSLVEKSGSVEELQQNLEGQEIQISATAEGVKQGLLEAVADGLDVDFKVGEVDRTAYDEFKAEVENTPINGNINFRGNYGGTSTSPLVNSGTNTASNTTSMGTINTGQFWSQAPAPTPTQTQPTQQTQAQETQTTTVMLEPNTSKIEEAVKTPLTQDVNLKIGKNEVKTALSKPATWDVNLEPKNITAIQDELDGIPADKTINLELGTDSVTEQATKTEDKTVNLVLGEDTITISSGQKTVNLIPGKDDVTAKAEEDADKKVNLLVGDDEATSAAEASADKPVNLKLGIDDVTSKATAAVDKPVNLVPGKDTTGSGSSSGKGSSGGKKNGPGHAKGIKDSPYSHRALVGEEGPELIQKRDYAYIAGLNGPEFAQIEKGDTVYTNEETKKITSNGGAELFPRYAVGYQHPQQFWGGGVTYNPNATTSGANNVTQAVNDASEKQEETWENSFDRLYNLLEDIAEEQRKSTRLQNEFEDILSSPDTNAIELNKNLQAQINSLRRQEDLQKQLLIHRRNQINGDMQAYAHLNEYARYNWDDMTIEINWDKIEANKNPDIGAEIEKYISHLEEWQKSMDEANDELRNIKEAIDELKKTGQEEYLELEQNIFDALKEREQKEIDELSSLNDSLNTATEKLLSSLAEAINEQRQARENERTEESIIDKERRLDYLKQDTSGANALEIKKLEEELTKSKEDYTDDLIDQKLNDLQKQNDEAAEQRERQISIAQANLDHMVMFGRLWGSVSGLYEGLVDSSGNINKNSPVYELLKEFVNYEGMSEEQRKKWEEEIQNSAALAHQYESGGKFPEIPSYEPSKPTPPPAPPAPPAPQKPSSPFPNEGRSEGVAAAIWILGGPQSGWGNEPQRSQRVREKGLDPVQVQGIIDNSAAFLVGKYNNQRDLLRREYTYGAFKTGGLADFTGPAWLDGTKSKPELVLNQQDTQNFIQLKNILASAMKNTPSQQDNRGNISFNINVEVGSIANDYDVDDMVDRIKDRLNDDAMYRNINSINLIR